MKKETKQTFVIIALLSLLLAAAMLSVNSGYAKVPFSTAFHSIFQPHADGTSVVVAQFRVPRIVLAVLCGMGLALAGCVMQTVTGNPLADPGILGVNAGAGFAVMLFLTFFPALHIRTMIYQPVFAIAGGLCTTGLLYLFAKRSGKLLPVYFLLGGIGLAALFSSFMLIMAADMDNSSYQLVARWLAGNIWGTSWHQVLALLPYMLILVPILLTRTNVLDILLLGENTALSLGIAVERELKLLLIQWALASTGMSSLEHREMDRLSGGQQQRAWIAMALAQKTGLLFLDEPTTYLDISHQLDILCLLRQINRENGVTIVMVLHDLNHATMFSDYLVAIKDGALHSVGTPKEVVTQQTLREVFDVEAEVITHPVLNVPVCLPYRITEQNEKTGGSNT